MANYKLTNDYWETSGIYDIGQGKTQREINNQIINDIQTESVFDKVPYAFRKTGGDNTVGKRENDKLVGGTVVWNQLIVFRTSGEVSRGVTFGYNSNNKYTASGQNDGTNTSIYTCNVSRINVLKDHVYLLSGCPSGGSMNSYRLWVSSNSAFPQGARLYDAGNGAIKKAVADDNAIDIQLQVVNTYTQEVNLVYYPLFFDLTAMFGSTVADAILAMETATAGAGVAFFRSLFPNAYYAYNSGTLMSVNAASHDTVGFNLFDKNATVTGWVNIDGTLDSSQSTYRTSDYIRVTPNQTYYMSASGSARFKYFDANKNVITSSWDGNISGSTGQTVAIPSGVYYVRKSIANSYLDSYCFNVSDSAKNGTYEPYNGHTYPLDSTLTLRGIPKLDSNNKLYYDGDEYASDGTVTRKYGIVDLGTLEWTYYTSGTNPIFYSAIDGAKVYNQNAAIKTVCAKYTPMLLATSRSNLTSLMPNNQLNWIYGTTNVTIRDDSYTSSASFKTAMSGVYLVYELATPTTESASPYTNPQICDGSGTEEYVDAGVAASERDVSVPVGHDTEYMTETASNSVGWETDYSTMIAPTEKDFTATRAYSANNLFIVSGQLYKATSPIASGAAITVGTNATPTTVGELLTQLLNA